MLPVAVSRRRRAAGALEDVLLLTLVVFLLPVVILALGAPLVLLLRLVQALAARF